jgi:hypothetical protein
MFANTPLPDPQQIQARLRQIFPEGTSDRNYLVSDVATKTIFTMIYINAVEGEETPVYLTPKHVYRMTEEQSRRQDEAARLHYVDLCRRPSYLPDGRRWYQDNTREVIRDETLRGGFVDKGVILVDNSVPTSSSKGRYILSRHFAELFTLEDDEFDRQIKAWQEAHLATPELVRIRIISDRRATDGDIIVNLPDGTARRLGPGLSSWITKAVIEEFALRHLNNPAVLWISESGRTVTEEDNAFMRQIGVMIDQRRLLPDIVLADTEPGANLIIFVEVVATGGPVTTGRKEDILSICERAGLIREHIAFVSAFEHRDAGPLKRRFSGIAIDTLIWCAAEPDLLICLRQNEEIPFSLRNRQP